MVAVTEPTMIDLDRLWDARDYFAAEWDGRLWDASRAIDSRPVALGALDALLDAPRVWWCDVDQMGFDDDSTCDVAHPDAGCGWRALVPVKEGK